MASTGLSSKSRWLRTLTETAVRDRISWRGMLVLSSFWFAIAYSMQPLGGNIIPLTLIAFVTSYWALLVVYVLFQMASNTAQGPYQGMLPDQVPADQRAEASGYYGLMNMVGTIFGFLVVGALLIPTHHVRLAI